MSDAESSDPRSPDLAAAPDLADYESLRASYPFGSVAIFDSDLRYRSVRGRGWEPLGIDPAGLEGRRISECWDPPVSEALEQLARAALRGFEAMARITYQGGHYEVWAGPLPAHGTRPRGLFLSRDATAEVEDRIRYQLLERATDAASMGIVLVDIEAEDQPIVYASGGFSRLTGYSKPEVLGRNCRFLQGESTDRATVDRIRRTIEERGDFQGTLLNYRRDGTPFWNRLTLTPFHNGSGAVSHYVGIQEDVTRVREAEVERDHQRRLAELGTLAGSVAHDFKNILMEMRGRLTLHEDETGVADDPELREIRRAAERGTRLVGHLLDYAHRHAPEEQPDLEYCLLRQVIPAVTRLLPASIRLRFDHPSAPLYLPLSETRLEQVLLNLSTNASEAMVGGGTLSFLLEPGPDPGWVTLTVEDDGQGMPADVLEKAFTPFFTTKGADGTGLGLSTVRRIVEQAGGTVEAESQVGVGTTFTFRFPLADPASPPDREEPETPSSGPSYRMGARVLLVDDEAGVRDVLERLLQRQGLEVVSIGDPEEALETYRRDEAGFDVVLVDRQMPGITGPEVLRRIWEMREGGRSPQLVLTSGDLAGPGKLPPGTRALEKPFEVHDLLAVLNGDAHEDDEGAA